MKLFDSLISDLDASVVKIVLNFVKIELHFKQNDFYNIIEYKTRKTLEQILFITGRIHLIKRHVRTTGGFHNYMYRLAPETKK